VSEVCDIIARCHSNPAPMSTWEATFLSEAAKWGRQPSPRQIAILKRIANRITPSEIALMLAERVEDLALTLFGETPTYRHGNSIRYGNRFSMAIEVKGNERGVWCAHDDDRKGGDALGLVAYIRGQGQADAIQWAKGFLGIGDGEPMPAPVYRAPSPAPEPKSTLPLARAIWAEAVPTIGTLVERYLTSRGLRLPPEAPLRFHPACPRDKERLPAMVALMTDPVTAAPVGIHRTYLRTDGQGKADGVARKMLGGSGVIRLSPDEEVTTGLGLTEGIETALSVMQVGGWSPAWAATSAGAISTFPVLSGIECLTVFADADAAGTKAARACAERWVRDGREVTIHRPPAGQDWNDIARAA
jgi:putative DNA primase/helicase